ncbi:MAG: tRNA (guanosine(37)-N1)-methyltransferase TrmD [Chloroflexi bacterium]|nr:tRNA (guanosine(37)-N1)-methyltransferase TrmD [Chloroflexota bacterium]
MRFHVVTLFPTMFPGALGKSVTGRAMEQGIFSVCVHDLREHGEGRHLIVDDAPFGGGPGMVIKPGPLTAAIRAARAEFPSDSRGAPVVLLDPQGVPFTQAIAARLAVEPDVVLVCGHYEGVDERVRDGAITEEISLGDFVLTGGEPAALVVMDAVARLIPGALGGEGSGEMDSFANGVLQYPHYTRPADFEGSRPPDVLLSGDHAKVAEWRRQQALLRTLQRRPDLLRRALLTLAERRWLMDEGWDGAPLGGGGEA